MTYSLVSAGSVGFDLARLPGGTGTAEVLLDALSCGPDELTALATVHPGSDRAERWAQVLAHAPQGTAGSALRLASPALGLLAAGDREGGRDLLTRLVRAPLGDLAALDRLVRHDVLSWTWTTGHDVAVQDPQHARAADVLVDAATSVYASGWLPDGLRRELCAPYLSARRRDTGDAGGSLAGSPAEVGAVLRDLAGWDARDRASWRAAVDLLRPASTAWTASMHEATWAVHLAGRLRPAADAQLRGVLAFSAAGLGAEDAAFGSWNALSGVLQALSVADLLADEHLDVLLRPWRAARGEPPR
jgi:hypothetical protein